MAARPRGDYGREAIAAPISFWARTVEVTREGEVSEVEPSLMRTRFSEVLVALPVRIAPSMDLYPTPKRSGDKWIVGSSHGEYTGHV